MPNTRTRTKKKNASKGRQTLRQHAALDDVHISDCTMDYFKSQLAPWGDTSPCLPHGTPIASRKMQVFSRSTVLASTDATHFGCVVVAPALMAANDQAPVLYTNGTDAVSTVPGGLVSGVVAAMSNSDYVTADFGSSSGLQWRLVTCGIRVMYSGSELNRGGRIVALEHPDHEPLSGNGIDGLLAYREVQRSRPSGESEWTEITMTGPKTADEFEYQTGFTSGFSPAANQCLVLAFDGLANISFEFEVWANFEIIGRPARGKTHSHQDTVGARAVDEVLTNAREVTSSMVTKQNKSSTVKHLFEGLVSAIKKGTTYALPVVRGALTGGIPGAAKGLLGSLMASTLQQPRIGN